MVNSVSTTFYFLPLCISLNQLCGRYSLVHQGLHLLLQLGVASRTLFFSLQGRSCLGNSFLLTTQCSTCTPRKLHQGNRWALFLLFASEGGLSQSTAIFLYFLGAFLSSEIPEATYPLRASPVIHPPFQALTTSLFFYTTTHQLKRNIIITFVLPVNIPSPLILLVSSCVL